MSQGQAAFDYALRPKVHGLVAHRPEFHKAASQAILTSEISDFSAA